MKKLMLTGIGILFSTSLLLAQTDTSVLPQTAQDLIQQNFSGEAIAKVEKNDSWYNWDKDEMYEVRLKNGIKLDFNKEGELTEIDSKEGTTIPLEVLPEPIRTYLESHASDAQIVSWERDDDEQEVKLADGRELEFDANGKFLKED